MVEGKLVFVTRLPDKVTFTILKVTFSDERMTFTFLKVTFSGLKVVFSCIDIRIIMQIYSCCMSTSQTAMMWQTLPASTKKWKTECMYLRLFSE